MIESDPITTRVCGEVVKKRGKVGEKCPKARSAVILVPRNRNIVGLFN
jgi:hypothetical protein